MGVFNRFCDRDKILSTEKRNGRYSVALRSDEMWENAEKFFLQRKDEIKESVRERYGKKEARSWNSCIWRTVYRKRQ